jgi:hypothetical protein
VVVVVVVEEKQVVEEAAGGGFLTDACSGQAVAVRGAYVSL